VYTASREEFVLDLSRILKFLVDIGVGGWNQ